MFDIESLHMLEADINVITSRYIYANVWMTNTIVKINPENGNVVGLLDLTSLADEAKNLYPWSQEMNGVAYDSVTDKIFVTGKMWPKIYEIKFNH